jgi:uncharacterized RDD family membrane protein YckC
MSQEWNPPPSPGSQSVLPPLNYALWADRVIAALADAAIAFLVLIALYVLLWLIMIVFGSLAGAAASTETEAGQGIGMLGALGCYGTCCVGIFLPPIAYFVTGLLNKVYWVSKRGYSIGQGLMKLRVVDQHGNLISMGTATIRLLATVGLGFIPVVGGFLDLLWPLWDKQRQTLHDKAVGTFVIKES